MESKLQIVMSFAELNAFFFFVSLTSWMKKTKQQQKHSSRTYLLNSGPHFGRQRPIKSGGSLKSMFLTPHAPALVQPSNLSSGRTRQHGSVTVVSWSQHMARVMSSPAARYSVFPSKPHPGTFCAPPFHVRAKQPVCSWMGSTHNRKVPSVLPLLRLTDASCHGDSQRLEILEPFDYVYPNISNV